MYVYTYMYRHVSLYISYIYEYTIMNIDSYMYIQEVMQYAVHAHTTCTRHTAYTHVLTHTRAHNLVRHLLTYQPPEITHAHAPYRREPHWRQPAAPRTQGARLRCLHIEAKARSCSRPWCRASWRLLPAGTQTWLCSLRALVLCSRPAHIMYVHIYMYVVYIYQYTHTHTHTPTGI